MHAIGHSEYEKLKILYADSLKDIRDLTVRLEQVSSQVNASASLVAGIQKPSKSAIQKASETFKTLFNQKTTRADNKAVSSLSRKVGKIAGVAALLSGLVFGGGGFWAATLHSSSRVNMAERKLAQANLRLESESKRADAKIAELEKRPVNKIAKNSRCN